MGALEISDLGHAMCKVQAGVSPSFALNRGFSALVRNGAGDYTLTFDDPIDANESTAQVQCLGASGDVAGSYERPNDNTIRVHTVVASTGTATDINFDLFVQRKPAG
jgi:hypothetical protein